NVTPSFFTVLGAQPERGRLFSEEEGTPGKNKVAVLSHAYAAKQPGGIDGVVGRTMRFDDQVTASSACCPSGSPSSIPTSASSCRRPSSPRISARIAAG